MNLKTETPQDETLAGTMSLHCRKMLGAFLKLDGLRGLAILMVLCLHYLNDSQGGAFGSFLYRFKVMFRLGWSGVDLFFVLSGFLIGGILLNARNSQNYYRTFYLRRVNRIFPIYYAWILLYLLIRMTGMRGVGAAMPAATSAGSLHHIPFYLLFLQNLTSMPFGTFDWYWLAVTWSLAVEEQFYFIAPVLIRTLSKRSIFIVLCATVVLTPVLRDLAYRVSSLDHVYLYILMPFRADSLALGMLAAVAWQDKKMRALFQSHRRAIYAALMVFFLGYLYLLKFSPGPSSHLTCVIGVFLACLFLWLSASRGSCGPRGQIGRNHALEMAHAIRRNFLLRLSDSPPC